MYDLPYHKENNEEIIKEFIDRYSFAFLTACDFQNMPVATQVPLFIEDGNGKKVLRGHLMKNTDHHKAFLHNENVLAVFTGHHTYVSGTWYSNPFQPSTWNYMSVHIKGTIRFLDEDALIDVLRKTTLHYENHNSESSTIYDNLPPAFMQKLIRAIVAFEIEIKETDTVFKLSQDRDIKSYQNIMVQLRLQGEDGKVIAEEMEKRMASVFGGVVGGG